MRGKHHAPKDVPIAPVAPMQCTFRIAILTILRAQAPVHPSRPVVLDYFHARDLPAAAEWLDAMVLDGEVGKDAQGYFDIRGSR